MDNTINGLGYTVNGDKSSKRKKFITKTLLKLVDDIQNKTFEESIDDSKNLEGTIDKVIVPSNIIDIYTRLEIILGLELSCHTDTLKEDSNLIDELYKGGGKLIEQHYRNAPNHFLHQKIELPSKILEQKAFNTRPTIEEHMLIDIDKSIHEGHISQPLQTNIKQFKTAISSLTVYNGIFNVGKSNIKVYFANSITDENGFLKIVLPQGA